MDEEINDDEVLSDCQSTSTTRPSSSISSDMPRVSIQSRSNSITKRQSSNIDVNDIPSTSLIKQPPIKVLTFNGKCSKVFKSTLEDCVEDCILEFPNDRNSIYVSKSGHAMQIPAGSNRESIISFREQCHTARQSMKSNHRKSSGNQSNSITQSGNARTGIIHNLSLPTTALAATTATRMRNQLIQQKLSFAEDIYEETSDQQTAIEQPLIVDPIEPEIQSQRPSLYPDDPFSPSPTPFSLPPIHRHSIQTSKKDYRLSDLVMLGPEYFADVFNLPRHRNNNNKITENSTELDRIKQDLFHRYLWTQKPQVSSRIRPISSYLRSQTFVI